MSDNKLSVVSLPFKITEFGPDMLLALDRNFSEIERILQKLQIYENHIGRLINNKVTNSGMDDQGNLPTSKLTEKLVGLENDLKLADAAVTEAKIATGAITTPKLANLAVDSSKLSDAAVTSIKLAQDSVTLDKFGTGLTPIEIVDTLPTPGTLGRVVLLTTDSKLYRDTGTAWTAAVPTSDLTGQVTTDQIVDGSISTPKLANLAVDSSKLSDAAVTSIKLAQDSVTLDKFGTGITPIEVVSTLPTPGTLGRVVFLTTDSKLYRDTGTAWTAAVPTSDLTGQITETQITDSSISTPKLKTGCVTSDIIATDAVTANKILAGAVQTAHLAASSVNADKIAAGAIGATAIAAGVVSTDHLAASAVTADKIAADAITANKILAGAVQTAHLAASSVNADKIAAGAIGATAIAAGAVITDKLAADSVTAAKIAAGAITADKVAASAITSDKLSVNELSAITANLGNVNAGTITADVVIAGQYANRLSKSPATVIVAMEGSSLYSDRADIIIPLGAVDAHTYINQAINGLPTSGGKVTLLDGLYIVSGGVQLLENVTVEGQGAGTVVKLKDGHNADIMMITQPQDTIIRYNVGLGNLVVDGNIANNTGFIRTVNLANMVNLNMLNVKVKNTYYGLRIEGSKDFVLNSCWVEKSAGRGFDLYNNQNGFVTSCTAVNNDSIGLWMGYAKNCIVVGNVCYNNGSHGVFFWNSDHNQLTGNVSHSNGKDGASAQSQIALGSSDYNDVQHNVCRKGANTYKCAYGIYITSTTSVGNFISNNDLYDSGATSSLLDGGTSTVTTSGNRL